MSTTYEQRQSLLPVSDEQREAFERDGYFIFDPGLDESVLDGVVADMEDKYREGEAARLGISYADEGRVQDAWKISANVKAVALAPRVLSLLEGLYGRRPLPFQTLNFPKGTQQLPHSDTFHFNSMPPTFMCGVWVALEDIDMENGPLIYYPGSHKLPELKVEDVSGEGGLSARRVINALLRRAGLKPPSSKDEVYPTYERFVGELIARHGLEPRYGTIRKGQALVWSSNLLHGGAPLADKTRTRHSQVTHYFFEGCRYYTPVLSRGDQITWRDPAWIT
jgi:ectoine hydroxylase-related dioxygenase (phytanoyl-CoA dioxygenase family)